MTEHQLHDIRLTRQQLRRIRLDVMCAETALSNQFKRLTEHCDHQFPNGATAKSENRECSICFRDLSAPRIEEPEDQLAA